MQNRLAQHDEAVSLSHETSALDSDGLDDAVLGAGLPPAAEALIRQAGLRRQQVSDAWALLEQARVLAPRHPATLIALYRFHFYGNRLEETREIAIETMALAAEMLGLPARWQDVQADARFTALEAVPRFFLFTLKGLAYLSLRLGDFDTGREALTTLDRLDPKDFVGHRVLGAVLARMGRDDLGYEDCPDIAEQSVSSAEVSA